MRAAHLTVRARQPIRLDNSAAVVLISTMPRRIGEQATMTTLLLKALKDAESLNGVAKATGVQKSSIVRFVNGEQTLRLDMAERLADYFGIECIRRKER